MPSLSRRWPPSQESGELAEQALGGRRPHVLRCSTSVSTWRTATVVTVLDEGGMRLSWRSSVIERRIVKRLRLKSPISPQDLLTLALKARVVQLAVTGMEVDLECLSCSGG